MLLSAKLLWIGSFVTCYPWRCFLPCAALLRGVPQGSTLVPLLFTKYMLSNDVKKKCFWCFDGQVTTSIVLPRPTETFE